MASNGGKRCADCRDIGFIYEPDGPAYPCPKCDSSLKYALPLTGDPLGYVLGDIAAFTPRKDGWKPSEGDF